MKLLSLIVAAINAQSLDDFVLPDLSSFDLSSFGLGPNLVPNLDLSAPAEPANDERYFFVTTPATTPVTTPTTTPTTTIPGASCWKCDQMTYTDCASQGSLNLCHPGDTDCCFVEIRETRGNLAQLCTGCKAEAACVAGRNQNFQGHQANYQCRPDYRYQKIGKFSHIQSVCRQCFKTCNPSVEPKFCFGSIESNVGAFFNHRLNTNNGNYPFTVFAPADAQVLGISTHTSADSSIDPVVGDIAIFTAGTLNLYFENVANGKVYAGTADTTRDHATEMVFWGLHGASQAWWESDLKVIQTTLEGIASGLTVANFA